MRSSQFVAARCDAAAVAAGTVPAARPGHWDVEATVAALGGDRELLAQLRRLLATELPGSIARIEGAAGNRSAPELARAAHAVKGMVSHFRAAQAVRMAADLEAMARDGATDAAVRQARLLCAELQILLSQVESGAPALPASGAA
ncbi:MAG: Hpt domain-containing protein [Gammaproteobacteria bacterium]|nr:Hpt domain-containing protein [Gammaproteobacteria bacterium]